MTITTSKFEKQLIYNEVIALRARRILEIGAFKGKTTAVLNRAAAQTDGCVVAIDPMKWASKPAHFFEWLDGLLHPLNYERSFWRNVLKTGTNRVKLFRTLSTDPALLTDPSPDLAEFDLVFIDGEHTYETARADVYNWGGRVRAGGKILLHDVVRRFPGVVRVMHELATDPAYRVTWPERHSIGIIEVLPDAAQVGRVFPRHHTKR
jgi:predicted O-methyltransferase YrrM